MPRRKKTIDSPAKKGRRVDLAVRVAAKPARAKERANKKHAEADSGRLAAAEQQEEVIIPEIAIKKDPVNVEKQKQMIMWVGVTFFMVVIVFFWLFNISSVFKTQVRPTDSQQFNLDEISARFSETMNVLSGELGKLQENAASSTATTTDLIVASSSPSSLYAVAATTTASSTAAVKPEETATGTVSQKEVEALKARLLELERKLEAQSSAKSSKVIR
jgi:hypothetical protein